MMQESSQAGANDSDYELEEEAVVHVEVAGVLQDDFSHHNQSQFHFVDLDSSRPLVQIGNQVFVGEYRDTIGTSVFFRSQQSGEDAPAVDPVFGHDQPARVDLVDTTNKKLLLKRVFLKPTEGEAAAAGEEALEDVQEDKTADDDDVRSDGGGSEL